MFVIFVVVSNGMYR